MIVIGKQVFSIVPDNDPFVSYMREDEPDFVELIHYGHMYASNGHTYGAWGITLETAESIYGPVTWVCPD